MEKRSLSTFSMHKDQLSCILAIAICFLSSCGIEISNSKNISKSKMIKIAREHYCSLLENYPHDYCIHLLKPHFARLPLEDKQEVALNFIVFGDLDAGSAVAFTELIESQKCQILNKLKQISDEQLKKQFSINQQGIFEYRRKIKIYSSGEPDCIRGAEKLLNTI